MNGERSFRFCPQCATALQVIVQAEDRQENQDRFSHSYYYRSFTLPDNTDFAQLKCVLENSQLCIRAPLVLPEAKSQQQAITVEVKEHKEQHKSSVVESTHKSN